MQGLAHTAFANFKIEKCVNAVKDNDPASEIWNPILNVLKHYDEQGWELSPQPVDLKPDM